jgi:hypothetical protein
VILLYFFAVCAALYVAATLLIDIKPAEAP